MTLRALRRGSMAGRGAVAAGIPTWVASSSGGLVGAAATATRPVGTAVGDHLFLVFHAPNAQGTPPTLTGWTKLSGYDLQTSPKWAIYDRIADLTATDQPSIGSSTWFSGWSMTAIRGGATISVPVAKTTATGNSTMVGPVITTTAADSLILSIGLTGNNNAVSAPTGGATDRYRANANYYGVGVATQDKAVAGVGNAASWAVAGGPSYYAYALALTA